MGDRAAVGTFYPAFALIEISGIGGICALLNAILFVK